MTVSPVLARGAAPVKKASTARRWVVGGVIVLAAFALLAIVSLLSPPSDDATATSVTNSGADGAKAVAQVLAQNGVTVRQVTTLDEAVAAAKPGTTLVITVSDELSEEGVAQLNGVPADVVLIPVSGSDSTYQIGQSLSALTDGVVDRLTDYSFTDGSSEAACSDPDAVAAVRVDTGDYSLVDVRTTTPRGTPVTACFPTIDSYMDYMRYADMTTPSHRLTVVASDQIVRNDAITHEGNAALALRMLGRHPTLTWYLARDDATPPQAAPPSGQTMDTWALMPGWTRPVIALLLVAAAAAAFWRGRRFGALVPEKLPVAVPASEATTGLGKLYRQSRSRGHAGAALRAASIARLAARWGIPATADADVVTRRVAGASGYDTGVLATLLYGTSPETDADLLSLAVNLQRLESAAGITHTDPAESEHR